jgi:hypothetical protein
MMVFSRPLQAYKAFSLIISLYGRANFGWKTFWDSNPEWRSRAQTAAMGGGGGVVRHLGEAIMPEEFPGFSCLCFRYSNM